LRDLEASEPVDAHFMSLRTLRVGVALAALVAALGLPAPASPAPTSATAALAALDSGVLAQLNRIRMAHGLVPLRLSLRLSQAAEQHSREMGLDGYFSHSSADGASYATRISDWYPPSGFRLWAVGENLLWASPGVGADTALRLWMRSPEHRANILTAAWREIGIAAVHFDGAPGAFDGRSVTLITTDFGVRRS
jgi:uncharacterized protein YkwD